MSTITTINASDTITASRSVINTNFSNLNTDKMETSVLDTDSSLSANSDAKVPSQKAVKAYVDAAGSIDTGLKQAMTAGATISGATLPVPVYQNKTDNEVYGCKANDTNKLKFLGFGVTNGTDGNPIDVKLSGVVDGFTGLQEGEKHYVQDDGTIGTSPGTYEVLVGIAISETALLIQKSTRRYHGTVTLTDAGNAGQVTDTAVTTGFRPSVIRAHGFINSPDAMIAHGTWLNGTYASIRVGVDESGASSSNAAESSYILKLVAADGTTVHWEITITSVTDTGLNIRATQQINAPSQLTVHYEIEGIM